MSIKTQKRNHQTSDHEKNHNRTGRQKDATLFFAKAKLFLFEIRKSEE